MFCQSKFQFRKDLFPSGNFTNFFFFFCQQLILFIIIIILEEGTLPRTLFGFTAPSHLQRIRTFSFSACDPKTRPLDFFFFFYKTVVRSDIALSFCPGKLLTSHKSPVKRGGSRAGRVVSRIPSVRRSSPGGEFFFFYSRVFSRGPNDTQY